MTSVFEIKLDTISSIKDFVNTSNSCSCEAFIRSGRLVVNSKSLIGVLSLDLSKTLILELVNPTPEMEELFLPWKTL